FTSVSEDSESRSDRFDRGPRPVLQRVCRLSDIDISGDPLRRSQTDAFEHERVIGAPLGDPIGDEAHRMRRDHHRHAHRTGRELLLPYRDWNLLAHAADHSDNYRRAHETVALLFDTLGRGIAFASDGFGEDGAHPLPALPFEQNKAPGRQLAV